MIMQTAPLHEHFVERWTQALHYCPSCKVATLQLDMMREVLGAAGAGCVTDARLMAAARKHLVSHGRTPGDINVCCPRHWRMLNRRRGACPHNIKILVGEVGEVPCGS